MLPLEDQGEWRVYPQHPYHLLLITEPLTRPLQLLLLHHRTFQHRLPLQHPLYQPRRRTYHHPLHHHLGISALTRAPQVARPKRRHVNFSKRRAVGHFRPYRTSLEELGGFSTTLPGRDRTDGEAARAEAQRGEIPPRDRVGVGLDSLGGLTMEDQEMRAAVLVNSSSVRMVGRRGWGQEGTCRVGMRISINLDISSSFGLLTLYSPE